MFVLLFVVLTFSLLAEFFFSSVLGHSANCPFWSLELSFKKIIGMLMLTHSLPPYITLWCWNSQDESDAEATLSYPSL